jgi:hypothetical protein
MEANKWFRGIISSLYKIKTCIAVDTADLNVWSYKSNGRKCWNVAILEFEVELLFCVEQLRCYRSFGNFAKLKTDGKTWRSSVSCIVFVCL